MTVNTKELAQEIYDEFQYYLDGYYATAPNFKEQTVEEVKVIIDKYLSNK